MCNCSTVCRIPDIETDNGRWPMPDHAPVCEDFKQESFVRVCLDGTCVIVEESERRNFGIASTTFEEVKLTRDQFGKLSEFRGF